MSASALTNAHYFDPGVAAAYDTEHTGSGAAHDVVVDDIPFYTGLALTADTRSESVLELGCGTGRVTIPMAQTGAPVIGIDNAAPMLAVACRKSQALGLCNVDWLQADMADFALGTRFGLVTIPFRSFQMLLTEAAQRSCLACIRDHLVDDGLLALNVANPAPLLAAGGLDSRPQRRRHAARDPGDSHRQASSLAGTSSDGHAFLLRVDRDLRLRYVSAALMRALLISAGFEVQALYGWFDARPFTPESTEMVWLVRKA